MYQSTKIVALVGRLSFLAQAFSATYVCWASVLFIELKIDKEERINSFLFVVYPATSPITRGMYAARQSP